MDSGDITPKQAKAINANIGPMRSYLRRLRKRMEQRRFPHDDWYYLAVVKAEDALQAVWVHMHYMTVGSGCGQEARE